jgi:hypothetical protein
MILNLYRDILRLPQFKGKSRMIQLYRSLFFSSHTFRALHGILLDIDPIDWTQSDLLRDGRIEPMTSALYGSLDYELKTLEGHAWNHRSELPENNLWASRHP